MKNRKMQEEQRERVRERERRGGEKPKVRITNANEFKTIPWCGLKWFLLKRTNGSSATNCVKPQIELDEHNSSYKCELRERMQKKKCQCCTIKRGFSEEQRTKRI